MTIAPAAAPDVSDAGDDPVAEMAGRHHATVPTRRRPRRLDDGALLAAAERMVAQIADLVGEVAALRVDNASLRTELETALAMFERSSAALSAGTAQGGRRRKGGPGRGTVRSARSRAAGRAKAGRRGRATPASVTPNVVLAVIGKLGEATAAEIAAEISRAGVPVGGRAVRHLAESAGARVVAGADGRRRYTSP